MGSKKILVADDDARVRSVIRSFLSRRPDWVVCGEAENGVDSIEQAKAKHPDLVLMDVSMPRMDGLEATRALRLEIPEVPVILISQNDPKVLSRQAAAVGAHGYCTKSDLVRNLAHMIDMALEDRSSSQQGDVSSSAFDRNANSQASELLAAIVDSSDDAIISKNLDGMITSWNKSAKRLFGYTAKEAIGKHITLIIPPDRLDEEMRILQRLRAGERVDHFQTVRMRKDGTMVDLSLTISPVLNSEGRVVGASKVARDITAQIRTAEALRESEERFRKLSETLDAEVRVRTRELEELSWQLFRAQDEERRHIARELHDSAGQTLTVLDLSLAQLVSRVAQASPDLARTAEDIHQTIQQLHREIRTTSYLLHPPLLDEAGLSSALSWYIEGLSERSDVVITLDLSNSIGRLPRDIELALFRMVQECLTNIHRHSGSKTAFIRIACESGRVFVEVRDEGKGIPPERLAEIRSRGSGFGLRGMRERLRHFGGELKIESAGRGTTVSASIEIPNSSIHGESRATPSQHAKGNGSAAAPRH